MMSHSDRAREEVNREAARILTDGALADRLLKIVQAPRTWPREQRDALLREAARRLRERPYR